MQETFFSAISTGQLLTIPSRIVVAIATFVALWLFLRRTALGPFIEAVGGNTAAANLAGVEARAVKIVAYMLSGDANDFASGGHHASTEMARRPGRWSRIDAGGLGGLGGNARDWGCWSLLRSLMRSWPWPAKRQRAGLRG
jgi:Branched-chain amino acid transport system / permease component